MRIEELEYHSPGTLTEACALLDSLARDAKIIAGGTDLLADLKQGLTRAKHLVALGGIPDLARIAPESDGGLAIGPLATASALADSDDVKAALAALADAAYTMAGVQIRNLGTIGGNIAGAVASADPSFSSARERPLSGPARYYRAFSYRRRPRVLARPTKNTSSAKRRRWPSSGRRRSSRCRAARSEGPR